MFDSSLIQPYVDKVYPQSIHETQGTILGMASKNYEDILFAIGSGEVFDSIEGELVADTVKVSPLSTHNRLILNAHFPFTKPTAFGTSIATLGLGDRLGLAGDGHIQAIRDYKIRPILAQQSIRELNLTHRTFEQVLDASAYTVFKHNYTKGYGADGDHLKLETDIEYALSVGMSMLTLDCSDYIDNSVSTLTDEELAEKYNSIDESIRKDAEERYLNQTFDFDGLSIHFTEKELHYNVVQYYQAIHYSVYIFQKYVAPLDHPIDFELSIDETMTVTSPASHFFVAQELIRQGVKLTSLAPRFVGEFQKGIDYIGTVASFEHDFAQHEVIAKHFGYKVSVHSGSDKLSIYPVVAKQTHGLFHVKTAGTNWLEALKVIAEEDPNLFRRIFVFAHEKFPIAQQYYHITPNLEAIAPLDSKTDTQLIDYLYDDNARQMLHVTFGLILTDKSGDDFTFRKEFFDCLHRHADSYAAHLAQHIGKHISCLSVPKENEK